MSVPAGYYRTNDDFQLADMLGLGWGKIDQHEADWVIIAQEDLPNYTEINIPRRNTNYLSGIVRGKVYEGMQDEELWCLTREVLDKLNEDCGTRYGLAVC